VTNQLNGKIYIGQTARTLKDREYYHIRDTFINNSKCAIHNAIRKYGLENFKFKTLFHCTSKADMDKKEKEMITSMQSKGPGGYNLTDGGEGSFGFKHTEESKAKVRLANLGRKMSKEEIEKRKKSHSHKKMSAEHKERLIKISRNRKMTDEQKAKMSRLGKKHSIETRTKMSKSHKGKRPNLGKKATIETRLKLSVAHKGHRRNLGSKRSDEIKAKMSLAQLLRFKKEKELADEIKERMAI